MIYAYQNQLNTLHVVCSRNKTLANPTYLWSVSHKLTLQSWKFIPYRELPSVDYEPGYDQFCVTINDSIPQSFTGNTTCPSCNVHLIPGEYYIKIYQQTSATNLNPNLADGVVYETLMNVVGVNQNIPTSYSGTSDTYILYNPDND